MNIGALSVGVALGLGLSMTVWTGLIPMRMANTILTCLAFALGGYMVFKLVEKWNNY